MTNPFRLRWLQGWTFQIVLMEGYVHVEAHGFGICLRTELFPGESPRTAADRLVLAEDKRRRALHNAWLRGQSYQRSSEIPKPPFYNSEASEPISLVVVAKEHHELVA